MSPRCDTLGSPVVKAARAALGRGDVTLILRYVPKRAETELRRAFERASRVRLLSPEAREAIDAWFVETAVRLHRQGRGARCAGLGDGAADGIALAL
ncbi:MAG TPA: DUF6448 family protein [bacterium]|nr:DUF6448 family protein [bacterium]